MSKKIMFAAVVFALVFSGIQAMAQNTMATLSGRITDETGGVLPGVQIVVANTATGVQRTLTSDSGGRFAAAQLPPGTYDVTATIAGFDSLMRRGILLAVGQEANVTLAMKVGAVTEQVTVTEEAPLLDTSSSAVSAVVEEKRIQELPLNG